LITIRIQQDDFSLQEEYERLRRPGAGAIVTFSGLVRDFNHEGEPEVETLHLQHYPGMTEKLLSDIIDDAAIRWPLQDATVIHRVGTLTPGDQIVLVAVSSAHREAAFQAASFIMDYLKSRATLWKKTSSSSGSDWVEMKESDRQAASRWDSNE